MRNRILCILLIWLSFLSSEAFCFGRSAAREDRQSDVSKLVHLIQLDQYTHLYGAGILFKVEGSQAYFLTAAHVLPEAGRWKDLRIQGQVTNDRMAPAEVVGLSPGHDVAVLKLHFDGTNADQAGYDALTRRLLSSAAPADQVIQGGIVGYPDFQAEDTPWVRRMTWADEVNWMKDTYFGVAHGKMKSSIEVSLSSVCPMLFAKVCYRFPVKSWGYSGGALFSEAESGTQILGMVTHYSPLASETYAIPISEALAVAENLIQKASVSGKATQILEDGTGLLRFVSASSVEVLKGTLAGATISGLNALFPGGGDTMHGGGDSMHGGGDAMHGGGDSMHGGGMALDVASSHLLITNELKAIMDKRIPYPSEWFADPKNPIHILFTQHPDFKGIDAVFGYSPGVKLGETVYHGWSSSSESGELDGIQDFLSVYRKHQNVSLSSGFNPNEMPTQLHTVEPGVYSEVSLVPSFSGLPAQLGFGNKTPDHWEFPLTGTSTRGVQGTVTRNGSRVMIDVQTVSDKIESHEQFLIEAPIAQVGARTYECIGAVQYSADWSISESGISDCDSFEGPNGRTHMRCTHSPGYREYYRTRDKSYGLIRIQYDPERVRYEFKMILTNSPDPTERKTEVSRDKQSWGSTASDNAVPVEFKTVELLLQ